MDASSVATQFHGYRKELDTKYDKWERIVKLSRDITIESKRLIFHLHRIDINNNDVKAKTLDAAQEKVSAISSKWRALGAELRGEDHHAYLRAYSPGLQEYIEALAFLHYFKSDSENESPLLPLEAVRQNLSFEQSLDSQSEDASSSRLLEVSVPVTEYLLGIADTTGELMRLCINSATKAISKESRAKVFRLCSFVRTLYGMFVSFSSLTADRSGKKNALENKLSVMRSSLQKVEDTCYALEIRAQEFPEHVLRELLETSREEVAVAGV